jgi:hypothetical protein
MGAQASKVRQEVLDAYRPYLQATTVGTVTGEPVHLQLTFVLLCLLLVPQSSLPRTSIDESCRLILFL